MYRLRQFAATAFIAIAKFLGLRKLVWKMGISSEIRFWQRYLSTGGLTWKEEFQRRLAPGSLMDDHLVRLLEKAEPGEPAYHVLDVGAGPLTSLGKTAPGKVIHVRAVDPLADDYDMLLAEAKVEPPVRTEKCRGEDLDTVFGENTFHLTHARNCLDHSEEPVRAIEQMMKVTKPLGFVYLEHWTDEGEAEEYRGLHQWNFRCEDGHFIIWNLKSRTDLADVLGTRATIECKSGTSEGKSVVMVTIRKQASNENQTAA
jgi:SAM-dependent methyltransferase